MNEEYVQQLKKQFKNAASTQPDEIAKRDQTRFQTHLANNFKLAEINLNPD
jgi:hypothetical protein